MEDIMLIDYRILVKLGISMFLGFLIGVDRELKHKPLGLKTSMVIAVASCLITIVSIESSRRFAIPGQTNMDPLRLAAQIVSGVGFIGAGVILRRQNDVISGLTTAAMVWAASGLGIATGAGFYLEAAVAVVLIILAINLLPMFIKLLGPNKLNERDLSVLVTVAENDEMSALVDRFGDNLGRVKHLRVRDLGNQRQQLQLVVAAPAKMKIMDLYYQIKRLPHVLEVEIVNISS